VTEATIALANLAKLTTPLVVHPERVLAAVLDTRHGVQLAARRLNSKRTHTRQRHGGPAFARRRRVVAHHFAAATAELFHAVHVAALRAAEQQFGVVVGDLTRFRRLPANGGQTFAHVANHFAFKRKQIFFFFFFFFFSTIFFFFFFFSLITKSLSFSFFLPNLVNDCPSIDPSHSADELNRPNS
jgi:hypothetical protein